MLRRLPRRCAPAYKRQTYTASTVLKSIQEQPGDVGWITRRRGAGTAGLYGPAGVPPFSTTASALAAAPAAQPSEPSVPAGRGQMRRAPARPAVGAEEVDFLDLRGLVEKLRSELPARPAVGDQIDADVKARVDAILRRTRLNPREWGQHAVFRRGRYTRSVVGHSPGQFIALLLCWERGQQSPIHDHAGAHCFMKVLSGQLNEERFEQPDGGGAPLLVGESTLSASSADRSVGFMHDDMGLHRISNPSTEEAAVSLHIYSPPFSQCLVFPPTGAEPKTASMVSANLPALPSRVHDDGPAPTLRDLCSSLARHSPVGGDQPDALAVLDLLHRFEPDAAEWAAHCGSAHFSEFAPVQHVVYHDDDYSVVISCWGPDQGLPPQVVGRRRSMWMKVLNGSIQYQQLSTGLSPWEADVEQENLLPEGSSSVLRECAARLHRFSNASDSEPAVSVEIYSPPLTQFTYHTPQGIEKKDLPVLTGVHGRSLAPWPTPLRQGFPSAPDLRRPAPAPVGAHAITRTAGRRFLSFGRLVDLLDEALASPEFCNDTIAALLQKAVFDPEEWRTCLGSTFLGSNGDAEEEPRQVLLAHRGKYELLLTLWSHGQAQDVREAAESFSASSWTLVLEGELQEQIYAASSESTARPRLLRTGTLKEESVSFLDSTTPFLRTCASYAPCVSLHVEAL